MGKNPFFRAWFYFRQGWAVYFAFIFAAINMLTVTYFLAIDNYPTLKEIFPSFEHYVLIIALIGVPLLASVGYAHYKKTPSFRAEADVWMESNPYWARVLINSQFSLSLNLKMINLITKLSNNEKISQVELDELKELQKKFEGHLDKRTISNKKDQLFFKENYKL